MHIGCLFGTFDPPHNGHLAVAEHMLHHAGLDAVWLVVTPRNPFKLDQRISPDADRIAMVRLAVEGHAGIEACDAELELPAPNYTVDTLRHFRARWPEHRFELILGGDNLAGLPRWKDPEDILAHHRLLVYPRPGTEALGPLADHPQVHVMTGVPLLPISATAVRAAAAAGRPIEAWVAPQVADYIRSHQLYRTGASAT